MWPPVEINIRYVGCSLEIERQEFRSHRRDPRKIKKVPFVPETKNVELDGYGRCSSLVDLQQHETGADAR